MSAHTYVLAELWPPPGWTDKLSYEIYAETLKHQYQQEGSNVIRNSLTNSGEWVKYLVGAGKIIGRFSTRRKAQNAKIVARIHSS